MARFTAKKPGLRILPLTSDLKGFITGIPKYQIEESPTQDSITEIENNFACQAILTSFGADKSDCINNLNKLKNDIIELHNKIKLHGHV